MKKLFALFFIAALVANIAVAQVAVNTTGSSADGSAMLDVSSTTKGFLPPRMTAALRTIIASPATGLLVYQTDAPAGYYFYTGSAWLLLGAADGSETKVTEGTNVTVTGTGTTASPYVVNATGATALTIGQSYQGGKIFWLDATGQHGLIAALNDQALSSWSANRYTATTDGLYAGAMNTAIIMAAQMAIDQYGGFAARSCAEYSSSNYGDWYLPSKYELNLLYLQKAWFTGFAVNYYWSSTESTQTFAWIQYFGDGTTTPDIKTASHYVRAIRAF